MSDRHDDAKRPEDVIDAEPEGDGENAVVSAEPERATPTPPAGPIEGDDAGRGADPDLVGDADLEQGRGEDPVLDPGARQRREGL